MKKDITELFVLIDDFCKSVNLHHKNMLTTGNQRLKTKTRTPQMSMSEIITVILLYYQSPCKNFKYFYQSYLQLYKSDIPNLVSYERFVTLKSRALPYLILLMYLLMQESRDTNISFIDSSSMPVCHIKRSKRNKVFAGLAKLGKSTKGWFHGLKLHLVINNLGEIQGLKLTPGNVDDRAPTKNMVKNITGLLFGDKGYISKSLFQDLYQNGLKLVTGIKKTMKNKLMAPFEKIMLRKRSIIETVFDYLKNKFEIEHSRHRSPVNAFVHIIATLVSYSLKKSKPKVDMNFLSLST